MDNTIPLIVFLSTVQSDGSILIPIDNPWQKAFTISPAMGEQIEQTFFSNSLLLKVHIAMPHLFQTVEEALSGTWMGPRPMKALVLGCIDGTGKGGITSDSGSMPWYSRWKYMPLWHA
jgi:hypothetical protein